MANDIIIIVIVVVGAIIGAVLFTMSRNYLYKDVSK